MSEHRLRAVNLAELLTQTARRLPHHDALIFGESRWSWAELDHRVSALARALADRGVGRGDCVLSPATNPPVSAQTLFALGGVGAYTAPTHVRLTPGDVAGIARTCRPVAMVCGAEFGEHAAAVADTVDLPAGMMWLGAAPERPDSVAAQSMPGDGANAAVFAGDHA